MASFATPIAFLIFNRPDLTAKVFERIRQIQPRQLFVIADGPRTDVPEDAERCAATRAVLDGVDWPCEVHTNFADGNLGCGQRVATGLNWVFEQVEQAIILEDDCLPDLTFLRFCQELLERYQTDEIVMMVTGTNLLAPWRSESQSYHFTHYGMTWGWATWRRAWSSYDYAMANLAKSDTLPQLSAVLGDTQQAERLIAKCQTVVDGTVDTWDYQWALARLLRGGLSIVPAVNLVQNLGFDQSATHTRHLSLLTTSQTQAEMAFPLQHPPDIARDLSYDLTYFQWDMGQPDVPAILALTQRLFKAQNNIHALMVLRDAIARYPDAADLYYQQAQALVGLGQSNRAIEVLSHLLKICPDHQAARQLLSQLSSSNE